MRDCQSVMETAYIVIIMVIILMELFCVAATAGGSQWCTWQWEERNLSKLESGSSVSLSGAEGHPESPKVSVDWWSLCVKNYNCIFFWQKYCLLYYILDVRCNSFSALTLLVGWQEGLLVCNKSGTSSPQMLIFEYLWGYNLTLSNVWKTWPVKQKLKVICARYAL